MYIMLQLLLLFVAAMLVLWYAGTRLGKLHSLLSTRGSKVMPDWQPSKTSNFFMGYSFTPLTYIASPVGLYVLLLWFRKEDDPVLRRAGRNCLIALLYGLFALLLYFAYFFYIGTKLPNATK